MYVYITIGFILLILIVTITVIRVENLDCSYSTESNSDHFSSMLEKLDLENLDLEGSPGVVNIKGVTEEANAAKKEHSNEYYWCAINKCDDPGLEIQPEKYRTCIDICINKNFFQTGKKLTPYGSVFSQPS